MTVHLSEADARRLGFTKGKTKTTRKAAGRDGARSRCACGEEFTTDAAETRHVAPGHHLFESVLE